MKCKFVNNGAILYFCRLLTMKKMKERALILITNDDGGEAEGIKALTEAMCKLGDVVVMAPDGPRSGMSTAITAGIPISYTLIEETKGLTVYRCTGTPADCVKLTVNEVLERKPDLVVSGVNHGGNHAISVHYSGTIGAVVEGCAFDIPSIGVSLYQYRKGADFSESVRLGSLLAKEVLEKGLPHGTYLNMNVPNVSQVKGMSVCRQADGKWIKEYRRETGENGTMQYWLTGEFMNYEPIFPDNDTRMLHEGYASVVPCRLDVTDYTFTEELKTWSLGR